MRGLPGEPLDHAGPSSPLTGEAQLSAAGATFRVPKPPPACLTGPNYVACDGEVWRRSAQGWDIVPLPVADRLLTNLQADAADTSDWWHKRAAELAGQLTTAIRQAREQQHGQAA